MDREGFELLDACTQRMCGPMMIQKNFNRCARLNSALL